MAELKNCQDLLEVERSSAAVSSDSALESKLFVCKKESVFAVSEAPPEKPTMFPVPKSQILGKLKDFLGAMSQSNKELLENAKKNPENYDIEVLSGKESEVIEMDLMLGIADLHTPEAVAAAEVAIAGYPPKIPTTERFSGSEDEDDGDIEEDPSDEDEDQCNDEHNYACTNDDDPIKLNKTNKMDDKPGSRLSGSQRASSCRDMRKKKNKKRPKIVELS